MKNKNTYPFDIPDFDLNPVLQVLLPDFSKVRKVV